MTRSLRRNSRSSTSTAATPVPYERVHGMDELDASPGDEREFPLCDVDREAMRASTSALDACQTLLNNHAMRSDSVQKFTSSPLERTATFPIRHSTRLPIALHWCLLLAASFKRQSWSRR